MRRGAAAPTTLPLVPPHPAPAAASELLGGDLGHTIIYGVAVSIPMVLAGGMAYGTWIARRMYIPLPEIAARFDSGKAAHGETSPAEEQDRAHSTPSVPMVILLLLLPVTLTFAATLATLRNLPFRGLAVFVGHPFTALAIAALVAIYFFGIRRGLTREKAAQMAAE